MTDNQDIGEAEFIELLVENPEAHNRHLRPENWCRQIHKVPEELRSQNSQVFEPVMVSLGPYHHHNINLGRAKRFKYMCLDLCSRGVMQTKLQLYNIIHRNIAEIKRNYPDGTFANFNNDREIALMMLLDGCFILSFMENSLDRNANNPGVNIAAAANNIDNIIPHVNSIRDWVDFMGLASSIQYATRDITLLENQVPYFVITLLMDLLYDAETQTQLLSSFLNWTAVSIPERQSIIPGARREPPIHLLEACWRVLVMQNDNAPPFRRPIARLVCSTDDFYTNRSAMSLKAMGVKIHKSNTHFLRDIMFNSGCIRGDLHIPFRNVSHLTTTFYSNLIAYEVSPSTRTEHVVLCYINLMKSLIQTPEDMRELQRNGIVRNRFANDEQAVQAFKEITTFGVSRFDTFGDVRRGIDEHCQKKRKTWLVNLYYTHFQTPWSVIGFLAALCLLILSILQTIYTIHPKK